MSDAGSAPDRCRLYLVTPATLTSEAAAEAFAPVLAAALAAGDVACLLLRLPEVGEAEASRIAARLRPIAQDRGAAFLVEDRAALAAATGADGVHVTGGERAYAGARRLLGPAAIVGVDCTGSRDLAMTVAERDADYVAFSLPADDPAALDDVAWWAELMTVPCVAMGDLSPADAAAVARLGADFVAVGAGVWEHPAGPAAAVRAYNEAIEAAGAAEA